VSKGVPACGWVLRSGGAEDALIAETRRLAHGQAFDERPLPDLDSEALDFRGASESFAQIRTVAREDLLALRLTTGRA